MNTTDKEQNKGTTDINQAENINRNLKSVNQLFRYDPFKLDHFFLCKCFSIGLNVKHTQRKSRFAFCLAVRFQ